MNYYEQIKAEVVKCCPEIMELKFGMKFKDAVGFSYTLLETSKQMGGDIKVRGLQSGGISKDFYLSEIQEILGSPIELHHILRTMKLTGHSWEGIQVIGDEMRLTIPNSKVTHFEDENGSGVNYNWTEIVYNLALPVALQSEPTLKGLSELLSVNNK